MPLRIRLFATFLIVLGAVRLVAQPAEEWSSSYGGDNFEEGQALTAIPGGGFVMVGASSSVRSGTLTQPEFGSNDYLIVRVNADSTIAWERRIGGDNNDVATEVMVDSRNQIIVAGRSRSRINGGKTTEVFGFQEIWVVAYDLTGNLLWQQSYGGTGGEEPFGIVEADNGNILIAGRTDSPPHATTPQRVIPLKGSNAYWLFEVNPTGDFIQEFMYGGAGNDELWGLRKLIDGSIVLFGASQSAATLDKTSAGYGSSDMWLVRINQQGAILNQYTFGGDQQENPFFLTQYSNGDLFVSGQTTSGPSGNKTSQAFGAIDLWCIRFELATGNIVWEQTFGGDQDDNAFTGRKNINDYIVLAGNTRSGVRGDSIDVINGGDDAWLKYISPDGEQIWDITRGGNRRENIRGLILSESGGWYLVGESNSDAFDWKNGPSRAQDVNGVRANDIWYAKLGCDFFVELGLRDTSLCEGEVLTLRNENQQQLLANTSYLWSDGSVDSILSIEPLFDLSIVLQSVSPDACQASDTVDVIVHASPGVETLIADNESCPGFRDGAIFFEASLDAESFEINGATFTAPQQFDDLSAGSFTFRVNSSLDRCSFDTTVTITSQTGFSIDLGADREVVAGDLLVLDANPSTTDSLTYEWSGFPDLCNNCESQTIRIMESGVVEVTATNLAGCTVTTSVVITGLKDKRVGIPNAISPNNDGVNDRLAVFASAFVDKMGPMRVFDRWGNQVYIGIGEQLSITEGWDGTVNGDQVQAGLYTYMLPVVFLDGEERVYKGELLLIR